MKKDPKRIPRILKLLEKAWKKNPDLRFFQFLYYFIDQEVYYMEDEDMEERLKRL